MTGARITVVTTALIAGFVLAQLLPVARTNPPVTGDVAAPPSVAPILRRACYDCHSNATRWAWYSRVAPLSWIFARHVSAGRQQLNFSEWGSYFPQTRRRKLQWIGRAVREAQMPPWYYLLTHREAALSAGDRVALQQWVEGALDGSPGPRANEGKENQ